MVGLILAGGRGTRLGGLDKGLVHYQERPLVSYAMETLKKVTPRVLISANRNQQAYRLYGAEVFGDERGESLGPLAGIRAGMGAIEAAFLLTLPCDMPHVPVALFEAMIREMEDLEALLAVAHDGVRLQPLLMLVHSSLASSIDDFLAAGGRRVEDWVRTLPHVVLDVSRWHSLLANVNHPEDLLAL